MLKTLKKKLLSSALIVLLILTNTNVVNANEDDSQITGIFFPEPILNYIGDEVDASRLEHNYNLFPLLKASAPFPKRYSLKDEGYVTSVKHQNPYGTCWAHAALGSAESRYKKATGIDLNLSELQLSWFAYNNYGIADPLNLVKNDGGQYSYKPGEAFDAVLQLGGNQEIATNVLISGIGISDESNHLPYPSTGEFEPVGAGYGVPHERHITEKPNNNECYIGDYRVTAVDWYSMSDKNEIKTTLMEKGGLAISYFHDDANLTNPNIYNYGGKSYYCNDKSSQNHAVLLVGWDDDYSASNFGNIPPANGAWICKNSWSQFWGDEGYFYISYYDTSINNAAFGFTIEKITENNNYDIYQYDGGHSSASYNGNIKSSSVSAANIFKAQDNICIEKIGISTLDADTNYTIDIYVNGTADNPRSGELKYEQKGNITNAGYHTIELNNPVAGSGYSAPVKVSKDHYYSIVVKYSHENGANVKVPVDITASVAGKAMIENTYTNDLSFMGVGDTLTKKTNGNAKIKAYTKLDTEGQEYKEEYYYQNIEDDNYILEETKTKHSLESSITIDPTEVEGFTIKNGTGYSVLSGDNNGSLVLKVYYERNKYDLKYELDGGTFLDGSHDAELKYEASIVKPSDPTKNSYVFAGWNKEIPDTMPANDLTITARWEQDETTYYIVHHTQRLNDLELYDIKEVETKTANVNTSITAAPISIEGYTYSEKKTLADGNSITKTIQRGTSFETATKFDLYYNLNEYSLTLNKEEGIASVSGAGDYYFGETITIDAELEDGYEFNQWQWAGDKTSDEKMFSFEMETSNLELTAKANIIQYTITYNLNGGSATNPTGYNVKTDSITLINPTRSGYTFIGWNEGDSQETKETVVIEKGSTGNKEYTANWLKNEIDVSSIGLVESDVVFIDGEKYTVGNNSKIDLADARKKVITKYNIANNGQPDVHTQYTTDFEVYFLEKNGEELIPVHKEAFDSIVTYAGTAIRLTGKKGIRIITSVPTTKKTTLTNGTGIEGYKLYEYGAIMCWADATNPTVTNPTLIKQDSNTYKASNGAYAAAYSLKQNTNIVYKQENGLTKYSTVLTEGSSPWNEEQCKKNFAMRSFIILRPMNATDNSQDLIIYGGTIYRSISYVATQNKNKFAVGSSTYEFIWNLIKYGYPEMYDQEHQ